MILSRAQQLRKGDYVMSANTATPFEPQRVTELGYSSSRYQFIRCHQLAGISQMQAGWVDATAFCECPHGCTWDTVYRIWRDGTGSKYDVTPIWKADCRRRAAETIRMPPLSHAERDAMERAFRESVPAPQYKKVAADEKQQELPL